MSEEQILIARRLKLTSEGFVSETISSVDNLLNTLVSICNRTYWRLLSIKNRLSDSKFECKFSSNQNE